MTALQHKRTCVIGLGLSGLAASAWLRRRGAQVVAVDAADTEALRRDTANLQTQGVEVRLGADTLPKCELDLAVVSPGVPWTSPILQELGRRQVPIIGELELGFQHARCLSLAITGTNGKTTTTELVERLLTQNQIKTVAAGNIGRPLCSVIEQTVSLDFLTLEVSSFQLEAIEFFGPSLPSS